MFENGGENFGKPQHGGPVTVVGKVETRKGRVFERKVRCENWRDGLRTLRTVADLMGEELLDWYTLEPR